MARAIYRPAAAISIIAALVVFVYAGVLQSEFINYDDNVCVTAHSRVQQGINLGNIKWAFTSSLNCIWHPLTTLSHMSDVQTFGMNPAGHHAMSLLVHIAASVMLMAALNSMAIATVRSFLVAALFAVHPMHVESVAWVSERKDVLSGLFWMTAMWAYARYALGPTTKRYLIVIGCFILGLLSKPMVITLPFVFLLLDYWPLGRLAIGQPANKVAGLILEKVPFFLLSAVSAIITIYTQKSCGALAAIEITPMTLRITNMFISYFTYFEKLLLPFGLSFFYCLPDSYPLWKWLSAAVFIGAVSMFAILKAAKMPFLITGWFWFLVTLLPVIGLLQAGGQAMADRYSYIPSIGLFIIVAAAVPDSLSERQLKTVIIAAVVIVTLYALLAKRQVRFWQNSASLYAHAIEVDSDNYNALFNMAMTVDKTGQYEKAVDLLKKTVTLRPGYTTAYVNLANLLLFKLHKANEAVPYYLDAYNLNPADANVKYGLGIAHAMLGDKDQAISDLLAASALDPKSAKINNGIGVVMAQLGKRHEAIRYFEKAVLLDPQNNELLNNLRRARSMDYIPDNIGIK
ncbi:MAG: tetratricopeptide repeat protein [Candidatus Magnetominusculus sp. LBB02]|nr:tetratricopeptide repeat protein [Candidatus Magnetominusculus sp. LBB02]